MKEYRCRFCHRLLFKHREDEIFVDINKNPDFKLFGNPDDIIGKIGKNSLEIKCSKCKRTNKFSIPAIVALKS